jgi:predicted AAA+ superfamily ATPase
MIRAGASRRDFVYVRFEDERLYPMDSSDLGLLLDAHAELYGPGTPTVFLDEVHEVPGWEKFVRRLADNGYRVFITGSNARMLSREVATTLGGRFMSTEVYPYSFPEFLTASGIDSGQRYGTGREKIERALVEWIIWGVFPEIRKNTHTRLWLENLYQKIFVSDIMARHGLRNPAALRLLVRKLAESLTDEMSVTRMHNTVASLGTKVGKATLIEYLGFLAESFLILPAINALKPLTVREGAKKHFFVDNGLLSIFQGEDWSKLMENAVAGELARRGHDLTYARDKTEVDFIIPGEAIQVSYSLADPETEQREVSCLIRMANRVGADRLTIVTRQEERTIPTDHGPVRVRPLIDWLLGQPHCPPRPSTIRRPDTGRPSLRDRSSVGNLEHVTENPDCPPLV